MADNTEDSYPQVTRYGTRVPEGAMIDPRTGAIHLPGPQYDMSLGQYYNQMGRQMESQPQPQQQQPQQQMQQSAGQDPAQFVHNLVKNNPGRSPDEYKAMIDVAKSAGALQDPARQMKQMELQQALATQKAQQAGLSDYVGFLKDRGAQGDQGGPNVRTMGATQAPSPPTMDFDTVSRALLKKNPNIDPEEFMAAMDKFAPQFAMQDKMKMQQFKTVAAGEVEKAKKMADLDVKLHAAQPKAEASIKEMDANQDNIKNFIDQARKMAAANTTGAGAYMSSVKGTDAYNLARVIDTIKSNVGFDKLQQMKDNSPTGSALGRVTNFEMQTLQNVIASLDQGQSPEQFVQHLDIAEKSIADSRKRIREAYDATYGDKGGKDQAPASTGQDDPLGLFR